MSNIKLSQCRHPPLDSKTKKCDKNPTNNKTLLKKTLTKSVEAGEISDDKIKDSSLYKKLVIEFENSKKSYNKQISSLKDEIKDLDLHIAAEKQTLLGLINKRNKIEEDITKATYELLELQQGNYERYWDVAARVNNEADEYEELLQLEDEIGYVSRGLPEAELEKFITKHETTRKQKNIHNPEELPQSCCICCQSINENDKICCLPCSHTHHTECIREWLGINKVCPLCRKEVMP